MKNPQNKRNEYRIRLSKEGKKSISFVIYADNDIEAMQHANAKLPSYGYDKATIVMARPAK